MIQSQHHRPETPGAEEAAPQTTGIGKVLRSEREKRGLSYSHISQQTRLRKVFLEALENEEWDRLPPPVFVRGFLRSYAAALGMDEDRVLSLYSAPETANLSPPRPLEGVGETAARRTKPLLIAVGLVLTAATGYGIYTYVGPMLPHPQRIPSPREAASGPHLPSGNHPTVAPAAPRDAEVAAATVPVTGGAHDPLPSAPRGESPKAVAVAPGDTESSSVKTASPPGLSPLILKANVVERTWVRIVVDDLAPKEYIFSAGSHPRWEAQQGFQIVIGNAGGIELELNGEELTRLGDSGKVIRLSLP